MSLSDKLAVNAGAVRLVAERRLTVQPRMLASLAEDLDDASRHAAILEAHIATAPDAQAMLKQRTSRTKRTART